MIDLRYYKMPQNDNKEWVDDKKQNAKVFNDKAKVLRDSKEAIRLKRVTSLPPFGDADKDKIPNYLDSRPFKKDKKSKWSLLR